jgi:hypothetical protein
MSKEEKMIESLMSGGVIGAALGALVTNNKNGAILGALAGAAISATLQASDNAAKTDVPVVMEEKGKLYKIMPGGEKKFIRHLKKSTKKIPQKFTLS